MRQIETKNAKMSFERESFIDRRQTSDRNSMCERMVGIFAFYLNKYFDMF